MKKFFSVLVALSAQFSFCADLMNAPFDQPVPTAEDITNIVVSIAPQTGIDTNAVRDIVNDSVGVAITNAFDGGVQRAVDEYIDERGVSSVITNLFENSRESFVSSIGGRAYGLMAAEAEQVVVRSDRVVLSLNVFEYPGSVAGGVFDIRFTNDAFYRLADKTYRSVPTSASSDFIQADLIYRQTGSVGQPKVTEVDGMSFHLIAPDDYGYTLFAHQLNGTNYTDSIASVSDSTAVLLCSSGYVDATANNLDDKRFKVCLVYTPSAMSNLVNKLYNQNPDTPVFLEDKPFYVVLLTEASSTASISWQKMSYDGDSYGNKLVYSLSYPFAYIENTGVYSTNVVPYGPMSPVITEWHLNNVSNDWNNIVQSTIDNEKSFFVDNLRLAEDLVSSASNVVDRAEALGQSIDSVSNSLVGISSEAYSAMSDSVSAAYLVFSNRLESSEEFLYTTMTNFEESAQTIQSSITDISNYVSEAVVNSFRESSAEYYFATNAEISSIRQYGVVTVRIPPEVAVEAYGGFENPSRVYSDPAGYPETTVQIAVDSKYSDDLYALLEEASDPSNQTSAATEHFNKKVPCICTTYFDSTQLVSRTTATYLVLKSSAYFNSGFSSTVQDDGVDKTGVDSIEPRSLRIDKRGLCFSYICVGAPVINFYDGSVNDISTVSKNSSVTYSSSLKVIYMMFPVSDFNLHTDITNSISPGSTARFLLNSFDQYSEYSYDTRPSVLLMYGFGPDKYNPSASWNACSLQNATVTLSGNDFITNGVSGGVVKYLVPTTLFSGYLSSNEVDRLIDEKLNSMH